MLREVGELSQTRKGLVIGSKGYSSLSPCCISLFTEVMDYRLSTCSSEHCNVALTELIVKCLYMCFSGEKCRSFLYVAPSNERGRRHHQRADMLLQYHRITRNILHILAGSLLKCVLSKMGLSYGTVLSYKIPFPINVNDTINMKATWI